MSTPENDETTTVAVCPALSGGLGAERKVIISMSHDQEEDGTWRVDLCITGMKEEAPAIGFKMMLENLLCGAEIQTH